MSQTNIVAFIGRKGGITKTTLALNCAVGLARAGKRVMLIDTDGQGNLSQQASVAPRDMLNALLLDDAAYEDTLVEVPQKVAGQTEHPLLLLSASTGVRILEADPSTPARIYDRVNELRGYFDYVIIDTSPGVSEVHAGVYYASDYVLLPTLLEASSVRSLATTMQFIAEAEKEGAKNGIPAAKILGIILNRFAASEKVQQTNVGWVNGKYGDRMKVYPALRNLTVWNQAAQLKTSIFAYAEHPDTDYSAGRQAKIAYRELMPVIDDLLALEQVLA